MLLLPGLERLPTIDTERLRLRWLTAEDVPALYDIFGDPDVCRYWSRPAMTNIEQAATLVHEIQDHFTRRTLFQWGVAERVTGEVIGTCTLAWLSAEHRRAEIGFALMRRAWGHGYMQEALAALLKFAFETLQLHRIEADADPRNDRSLALLERMGFKREGYLRERYFMNGEIQDAVICGLLRGEWRARING